MSDTRLRILLVDDDLPFRRALAIGLRLEGAEVLEASSREEALDQLRSTGQVALALVNQYLTAQRGDELHSEIARLSPGTRLVTVSCQPGLASALALAGHAVQLVKPVQPDQVLHLLAS
jgi:ActR/RegA family two-component response regulator